MDYDFIPGVQPEHTVGPVSTTGDCYVCGAERLLFYILVGSSEFERGQVAPYAVGIECIVDAHDKMLKYGQIGEL